jgi:8-oxo-dGTP pyrophosphatase MutT (NUDIX family)
VNVNPMLDEHADPVHVTASAVIVGPRGVALHRHKALGTWVAPCGHIDPGETPSDAAVREAAEETGLAVRHFDGVPNWSTSTSISGRVATPTSICAICSTAETPIQHHRPPRVKRSLGSPGTKPSPSPSRPCPGS